MMALVGNGSIYRSNPMRLHGALSWNDMGSKKPSPQGRKSQSMAFGALAAIPAGYYIGKALFPPRRSGAMSSSREAEISISAAAEGTLGAPIEGSASFSFDATATGQLVVSGSGSAAMEFLASAGIVGTIDGSGEASFEISASADIEALGFVDGSAAMEFAATLEGLALGWMVGTTDVSEEVTPESVAAAVWRALTSEYTDAGSFGEAMGNAGAAGNPWDALTAANNDPGSFGALVQKLMKTGQFMALK